MRGEPLPLAGDWALCPDFALRSAGFPVSGLEVFGPGDESGRLRTVAGDLRFREAMTWQNPAAVEHALLKVAAGAATRPSRARQREEVVASYWQRYCAKADTIGFFGPLAWGRIEADGPPLVQRPGPVERERAVHFEAWGIQALAQAIDPDLRVAAGPRTEHELRVALEAHPRRDEGLAMLARLEAARDAAAGAPVGHLLDALRALDAVFTELTGGEATRNAGRAYGARTLVYIDSMRDVDVVTGRAFWDDLSPALHVLFEAGRWYSGEVGVRGRAIVEEILDGRSTCPFLDVAVPAAQRLMGPRPDIDALLDDVHRRIEAVLATGDHATAGLRAAAAFADHRPGMPLSVFSSVDIQVAAASAEAVGRGEHLAVVGDVHPGGNPLIQGVFAHRHPDLDGFLADVGRCTGPMAGIVPPWAPGLLVESRGLPVLPVAWTPIALMPDARAPHPRRTWSGAELTIRDGVVTDPSGELELPLMDALTTPIFVSGVRAFDLLPAREHAPRVTIGRTVLQRESWSIAAQDLPRDVADLAAFARDRGMPRRVFFKSPAERKPVYLDTESTLLGRIACRQARQAREADATARVRVTEMLPGPEECWLADDADRRYVSELRVVAVDRSRTAGPPGEIGNSAVSTAPIRI